MSGEARRPARAAISKDTTFLTFHTPKGGAQGASQDDLDKAAEMALRVVYGKVKYPRPAPPSSSSRAGS